MDITKIDFPLLMILICISACHAYVGNSEDNKATNSGDAQSDNPDQGWFGLYRISDCKDRLIASWKNWPEKALGTTYDARPTIVDGSCHPWAPAIPMDVGPPSVGVHFGRRGMGFKALKVYKLTDGCTKSGYSLKECCEDDGYLGILNRSGKGSDFNAKTDVGQLRGQCVNANSNFWEMQFYQAVY